MKKILLCLTLVFAITSVYGQTTYFWVGGTGPTSFTANINWNTAQDGSGNSRPLADPTDILIFSGTNIGGAVPATGAVTVTLTSNTFAQLRLLNNASLFFTRTGGGTATLSVNGDASNADDLVVNAGCSLTINNALADGNIITAMLAGATGLIGGTITMANTGTHRFTSQTTNGLVFTGTAVFNSDGIPTTAAYPFGSGTQGVQNGVVFQSGATLNVTGTRSPMGGTSTFQSCNMLPGSNTYFKTNVSSAGGSFANLKSYGNVFIQNSSTFTSDGPLYKVDNLNIESGSSFITHTSGNTPLLGNLIVNGSLTAPAASSNILVMGGSVPQTISGTGTINIPSLTIANYSDVTLSKSVTVGTICNMVGKINFGVANQINGTGTFTSRVNGSAVTVVGNTTAGSYQITGVVGALAGNVGLAVSGAGLSANTNAVGFSTANFIINLSKPAATTTTGSTFTFFSDTATLVTANANGLDSLTGSVVVTGTKSFQSGTGYIINGATTKPFGISSGSTNTRINASFIEINAAVTPNFSTSVFNRLTINSKYTLRVLDTVRINTGAYINGIFNNSNYIVTSFNATNGDQSIVQYDGALTAITLPIGTATNYLPVTITPTTQSSFTAAVFEGITTDGNITGTPLTAQQKLRVVNAVWNINRLSGSGNATLQLGWTNALEGANFTTLPNDDIGIIYNTGSSYTLPSGTGNNTTNNATTTISSFGAFAVGAIPPVNPFIFNGIPVKTYGDADFNGGASSLNAQPITYTSSNLAVAIIVAGNIRIVGAGTSNITASQPTDGFYPAASVTQTLTVNKASLTITADNKTKFETIANPPLTISYTGFVLGETNAVLLTQPSISTTATMASLPGIYPITVLGAQAANYNITYVNGTLTVQANQQLVITFNTLSVRTYGNADVTLTATSTASVTPMVYTSSNVNVAIIIGNTIRITGAGTTDITASQAGTVGYFPAVSVTRTLTVNKANLTIRVADTSKIQGAANPTFTFVYTGFVLGETAANLTTAPIVLTTATTTSPAGYYVLTPQSAATNNYNITYLNGRLTILPLTGADQQYLSAYLISNNSLNVRVYSNVPALADVVLYNNFGQPVARKNLFMPVGFTNTLIPVGMLASGVYTVVIRGNNVNLLKQIFIQR